MLKTNWEVFYGFLTQEEFINSFASGLLATFIGGCLLTFCLFLIKEKVAPLAEINGRWYFQMTTKNSAFDPYQNMILTYVVMIGREGGKIYGTTEKIYENSIEKIGPFTGEQRVRGVVKGFVEKKYFGQDRVNLHIIENGRKRDSTQFHTLKIKKRLFHRNETKILKFNLKKTYYMTGSFTSTVADQDGEVKWQRENF